MDFQQNNFHSPSRKAKSIHLNQKGKRDKRSIVLNTQERRLQKKAKRVERRANKQKFNSTKAMKRMEKFRRHG